MTDPAVPDRCLLRHRGFATLGEISFRRSATDDAPVMIVPLGGREAAVPLRAMQRELAIDDDSADGRMLALIAQSLDYVAGLQPGDLLPREVLDGGASWEPEPRHRERAAGRLHGQLVAWLGAETGDAGLSAHALSADRLHQDARLRARLAEAFARAAARLGQPDAEAVVALLERVAEELAFIEALRDRLLAPVQSLSARLDALAGAGWRGDSTRHDSLVQAQRLAGSARRQIGGRFAEIDAQTGEVIATLRNAEGQRVFIRTHRDWLHRSRLAWEPTLAAWDPPPLRLDEATWLLIGRTYQFLAPRFMAVKEWQLFTAGRGLPRAAKPERVLQW